MFFHALCCCFSSAVSRTTTPLAFGELAFSVCSTQTKDHVNKRSDVNACTVKNEREYFPTCNLPNC